jgi:hypothetical protein
LICRESTGKKALPEDFPDRGSERTMPASTGLAGERRFKSAVRNREIAKPEQGIPSRRSGSEYSGAELALIHTA